MFHQRHIDLLQTIWISYLLNLEYKCVMIVDDIAVDWLGPVLLRFNIVSYYFWQRNKKCMLLLLFYIVGLRNISWSQFTHMNVWMLLNYLHCVLATFKREVHKINKVTRFSCHYSVCSYLWKSVFRNHVSNNQRHL